MGLVVIVVGLIILIYQIYIQKYNSNYPIKNDKIPSIGIVIPASYESKVISNLLESIKNQSYKINMKDIYVIVESIDDSTCKIVRNYNSNIIVRKTKLHRKGYALDDGFKEIIKYKHYDVYFIFDADNILDKDYISNMLESYYKGYDIGIGYRNINNGNDNVVSGSSLLTFSMLNQLFNSKKIKYGINVTISGTGFYILGTYIDKWNGYPFHSLTEDDELTLYSILNNMTSDYNYKAIFYDEQPNNLKVSIKERTRWVTGYFESRRKYISKIKASLKLKSNNDISKENSIHIIRSIIMIVIGLILVIIENIIKHRYLYILV